MPAPSGDAVEARGWRWYNKRRKPVPGRSTGESGPDGAERDVPNRLVPTGLREQRMKANPLVVYFVPIALAAVALVVTLVSIRPPADKRIEDALMLEVIDLVQDHYVEPRARDALVHDAIRGIMRRLDRHSDFLDKQAAKAADEETEGRFGGLGIHVSTQWSLENKAITILRPFRAGPAIDGGILPRDRIVAVGGTRLPPTGTRRELAGALRHIKGPVGTSVRLTVARDEAGGVREFDVTLERREVDVESVVATRMIDPAAGIGYLRILAFKERTGAEVDAALAKLGPAAIRGLVIDLRNNGGGLLNQACAVADRFLDRGLIVSTRGRHPDDTSEEHADRDVALSPTIPMVVLINHASASASEALAGALQDHGRAVIVGERSYGKGVVQSVYRLGRTRTSLKITTSRYYTPAGRCIERERGAGRGGYAGGILPDVVVVLDDATENAVFGDDGEWSRWLADEVDPRTPPPPPMVPNSRDTQLATARSVLAGDYRLGRASPVPASNG